MRRKKLKHLIIPDAHAHPDYNNDRFTWIGKLIADEKPDHVIMIGDWADMPSLCSYDRGTRGFEGRRYRHDLLAVHDAQERMFKPIKKRKKKLPEFTMLIGNHEQRIEKAVNADAAQLDGVIGMGDLRYEDFGWDVVPYEGATPGIRIIDSIAYAHYFTSGLMGRPISGINHARALISKKHMSSTCGHSHSFDYSRDARPDGKPVIGLVCGCYVDYDMSFAGVSQDLWWSGVVIKDNVEDGMYDLRMIGIDRLRDEYGRD